VVLGFEGLDYVLPGGKPEPGEDFLQTLVREVREETNMAVLHAVPIGFVHVLEEGVHQLRYACLVAPIGPFTADPAGQVLSIRTAEPAAAPDLLGWGRIGQALLQRAVQLITRPAGS
jgi:8-oxo-dGTP pyrophosphatase MutT (NUDIX family)